MRACLLFLGAIAAAIASATSAGAASMEDFGRCLTREGATFYGASWCSYCRAQRQTLGAAMSKVRYVECAVEGRRDATAGACTSARVNSYPTWVFADGTRAQGAQSLAALASRTGCTLPSGAAAKTSKPPGSGNSQRPPGPKIMEVPQ